MNEEYYNVDDEETYNNIMDEIMLYGEEQGE